MSEGQLDTPQIAQTLNDGTTAARDNSKEAKDQLYTDILNTWTAGSGGARDQSADMQRLTDGFHQGNMFPGLEIVGVDEQNNLIIQDIDSGEQQTVNQEQFEQLSIGPASGNSFANGSELRVEVDPATGNITKAITPAGEIVPGNGTDVDLTADGGVLVTNPDGTQTMYSDDGSWRTYSGSASDATALQSENRYIQDSEGKWHLQTTTFDTANGTIASSIDGGDTQKGHNLVINADGSYSYLRDGDNIPFYCSANGTESYHVMDYRDESKVGAKNIFPTTGGSLSVSYENGVPNSISVDGGPAVATVGIDADAIVVDDTTLDVTVTRPDGSTDLYKSDGSLVHSIPAPSGNGLVVDTITYPNGNSRSFSGYDENNVPHKQTDKDSSNKVTLEREINGENQPTGTVDSDGTYNYQEPGGPMQHWRTESSSAFSVEGTVETPTSMPADVQTDGPITTTTWTDENGAKHKKVENSELNITQEFTTRAGADPTTAVTITNETNGEVVTGYVAGGADESGEYRVTADGQPDRVFDQYGRLVEVRNENHYTTNTRFSYENEHTGTPNARIDIGPADANNTRQVDVYSLAPDGTETKIDGGRTVPLEGGPVGDVDWYLQYQREEGTKVNRDKNARITYEQAADGTNTSFIYPESGGASPSAIKQTSPDGSSVELEQQGDGKWQLHAEIEGAGGFSAAPTEVKVDPATGDFSYRTGTTEVERDAAGNATNTNGENVTKFSRGADGSVSSISRTTAGGTEQFTIGEDGNWNVDDMKINPDGSFEYSTNYGVSRIKQSPNGASQEKDTFANGDTVTIQTDTSGNPRSWTATDAETGVTEHITYPPNTADENAKPQLEVKDKDGNVVEVDPESITWNEDGSVSYTTADGQRIQQAPDGSRAIGKPNEDNNGFAEYDYVQWHEADGSESSRSYEYDDEGQLIHTEGTGTAAKEEWDRQPDGTFVRKKDGFVAVCSLTEDGTFKAAYRDEDGQVKVKEQRTNGDYRTRDSVPVEVELDSGRTMYMEEDGSMYGDIGDGDWYSAMAWDAYVAMYNLPDDMNEWSDEDLARWQEFSNKGYRDNSEFYPHFAEDPDVVYAGDTFTFQFLGQTGPVAAQGEDEPSPDEVPWKRRSYESLQKSKSKGDKKGDAAAQPVDNYDENGDTGNGPK